MRTAHGLIDIESLSLDSIRREVTAALASSTLSDTIADFVASVNWSHFAQADPAVRTTLGELEQASTSYADGDIDARASRDELRSVIGDARSGSSR